MSKKPALLSIGILLVFTTAALGAAPATEGAVAGEWTMDYDAAKALAAETGRPLLLNFTGSDWCGWCIRMDRQVFSLEAWQAYAQEHLVLVWIDFPRDKSLVPEHYVARNEELRREFGVQGFPTYILLDPDGETRLGQAGATRDATPESFIETLDNALLTSDKSVAALREKMTAEEQAKLDAAKLATEAAHRKLEEWIQTDPQRTDENIALFNGMRAEIETAEAHYLQLLKAAR